MNSASRGFNFCFASWSAVVKSYDKSGKKGSQKKQKLEIERMHKEVKWMSQPVECEVKSMLWCKDVLCWEGPIGTN